MQCGFSPGAPPGQDRPGRVRSADRYAGSLRGIGVSWPRTCRRGSRGRASSILSPQGTAFWCGQHQPRSPAGKASADRRIRTIRRRTAAQPMSSSLWILWYRGGAGRKLKTKKKIGYQEAVITCEKILSSELGRILESDVEEKIGLLKEQFHPESSLYREHSYEGTYTIYAGGGKEKHYIELTHTTISKVMIHVQKLELHPHIQVISIEALIEPQTQHY